MTNLLSLTIVTTAKATWLTMRAISYLLCGLLFGLLPIVIVLLWKVLKGGVKVTMWMFRRSA